MRFGACPRPDPEYSGLEARFLVHHIRPVGETQGERRRRLRTAGMFLEEFFARVAADGRQARAERVCFFCCSRNHEDVGKSARDVQMQVFARVSEVAGTPVGRSVEGWRRSRTDYLERVFDHVNARGWDVFVAVNTFRLLPGEHGRASLGRTRAHVGRVLRVQLDLDGALAENAAAFELMREDAIDGIVPTPSCVLRSSPEKYQVLWNVGGNEWTAGQAELYSHLLAARYGGDEVVTPVTQVMRVPGFFNAKAEYRTRAGSPLVEEVDLSRELWPIRRGMRCEVERFRPLEGVVDVDALRRGIEKLVQADAGLGVSWSQVDEAPALAAQMARENEGWRLRLREASAVAGVVLPARMRGTVPQARYAKGWTGRAIGLPRGAVADPSRAAPAAPASPGAGASAPGAPAVAAVAAPPPAAGAVAGRWVNRRGVPTFVPDRETRAERLRRVGVEEGWIDEATARAPVPAGGRKPSEYDRQDWGRVLQALENGRTPAEVVKALARVRSTGAGAKPDPLGYARKTVARAVRRLEQRAAGSQEPDARAGVSAADAGESSRGDARRDTTSRPAAGEERVPDNPEVPPARAGGGLGSMGGTREVPAVSR